MHHTRAGLYTRDTLENPCAYSWVTHTLAGGYGYVRVGVRVMSKIPAGYPCHSLCSGGHEGLPLHRCHGGVSYFEVCGKVSDEVATLGSYHVLTS
jgi:hypothetical protein